MIHAAQPANDTSAVSPPVYQTSTFKLASPEEGAELAVAVAPTHFYTRYGTPNTRQVELLLAELEGSESALAVGSGAAAVTLAVLSNVQAGDHVVAQSVLYTATMTLFQHTLERYGVEVTMVDQRDTEAFARAMRPNTKVLYTESPTNPTLDLTDLRATAEIAHAGGAVAICDNTFASSYNQRPLDLGCDLVLHSATKYLNGHADVTAGALMGSRELIERAWDYMRLFGPVLHPMEAWLLRRGLMTYPLRMRVHNENAVQVARFLEEHPAIERVYYPGLPSHPQHDLARKQMAGGFGGMLSIQVAGGVDAALHVASRVKLFARATSLGGVESLIEHRASVEPADSPVPKDLLRISIGLEDPVELVEDLRHALAG
jgi:methionine-gamma-lyase